MSFIYKAISSTTMGLNIYERSVYHAPAYDVTALQVPGRSGDLLIPNNRYANKTITYKGFVNTGAGYTELSAALVALKAWLCSDAGTYHQLHDTYDPLFYREAYISGETAVNIVHQSDKGATVTVTFSAKPFMYESAGISYTITSPGYDVVNPYKFVALPKMTITMAGAVDLLLISGGVGYTWSIQSYTGDLIVDSEEMDWYTSTGLMNDKVTASVGNEFPKLYPGTSRIGWDGNVSKIVLNARWRTL